MHDPDLRVEWLHDGRPLQSASRFHTTFDFGYVSLDVRDLVPEDQGHYTAKAVNKMGEATSSLDIQVLGTCRPNTGVVYLEKMGEKLQ